MYVVISRVVRKELIRFQRSNDIMKNILELLQEQPEPRYSPDSTYGQTAKTMNQNMDKLNSTMTQEQKDLLEAYFDDHIIITDILEFDRFRYAFNLGAQLMAEIIEGKRLLLKE